MDPGRARQLGGRRRPALREGAIQAEPVADVDAAQVEGSDRRPEQPLDKRVPARLLGVGAGHCLLLRSEVPNNTKSRPTAPLARFVQPTEVAMVVVSLLSTRSRYVNRADIAIDGGTQTGKTTIPSAGDIPTRWGMPRSIRRRMTVGISEAVYPWIPS